MNALVRIEADRVLADSRDVAAQFSKRHDHVLRSIDTILKGLPDLAANFGVDVYAVDTGAAKRHARRYDMDRKGFMLLVMGFNGAKALEIKSRWIDAFDAMEARLLLARVSVNDPVADADPQSLAPNALREVELQCRQAELAFKAGGSGALVKIWRQFDWPDVFDETAVPQIAGRGGVTRRATNDEIAQWLRERTINDDGARTAVHVFHDDYKRWSVALRGEHAILISDARFYRALGSMLSIVSGDPYSAPYVRGRRLID